METVVITVAIVFSIVAAFFSFISFLGVIALGLYVFYIKPDPIMVNVASNSGDVVDINEKSQDKEDGEDEDEEDESDDWWKKNKNREED
jgi:hypothetical protein